jgi:1-phosphatidylinositol-3-phosphate 5-kinase
MTLDHHSIIVFPQQWTPLERTDPFLSCPSFLYMSAGNQTLLPGLHDTFTPVLESIPLTIISYVLNSQKYHEEVTRLFELTTDLNESIESELLSGSDDCFEFSFHTFDFDEVQGKSDLIRLYGPSVTFHVKVYYVRQFQALRCYLCPSFLDFVLSMSRSEAEQQQLGKSGAMFFRSSDGKYIGKLIDEREFNMFADMAPNYFRHICKSFYHNMPSKLVHIVGVYRYTVKNLSYNTKSHSWLLIMRNLAYGISPKAVTYDLKGTLNSRRYVKEGEQQTKMDLNFIEELDSLPLLLSEENMRVLESAIWNDTLFLSKQNVIDYSLVVIVSREEGKIAAGVIDYLRQYTFDKAVESQYKKVMANELPTITDPTQYKERFRQQVLQKYFLALDTN